MKNSAHKSEQDVIVTGYHTVLISFYINSKMNEPGFENSMLTDDKSYEINIHAWVCIQNTTTGYKRAPQIS